MKKLIIVMSLVVLMISVNVFAETHHIGDWVIKQDKKDTALFQIKGALSFGVIKIKESADSMISIMHIRKNINPSKDILFNINKGEAYYAMGKEGHFVETDGSIFIPYPEITERIIRIAVKATDLQITVKTMDGRAYTESFNLAKFRQALNLYYRMIN